MEYVFMQGDMPCWVKMSVVSVGEPRQLFWLNELSEGMLRVMIPTLEFFTRNAELEYAPNGIAITKTRHLQQVMRYVNDRPDLCVAGTTNQRDAATEQWYLLRDRTNESRIVCQVMRLHETMRKALIERANPDKMCQPYLEEELLVVAKACGVADQWGAVKVAMGAFRSDAITQSTEILTSMRAIYTGILECVSDSVPWNSTTEFGSLRDEMLSKIRSYRRG